MDTNIEMTNFFKKLTKCHTYTEQHKKPKVQQYYKGRAIY